MDSLKPSIGDRLKDAAFGGALTSAVMTGVWMLENAVGKASKTGKLLPVKGQWKITGVAAGLAAAYGFLTAKKEVPEEPKIDKSTTQLASGTFEESNLAGSSTKFRDMVSQQSQQSSRAK